MALIRPVPNTKRVLKFLIPNEKKTNTVIKLFHLYENTTIGFKQNQRITWGVQIMFEKFESHTDFWFPMNSFHLFHQSMATINQVVPGRKPRKFSRSSQPLKK